MPTSYTRRTPTTTIYDRPRNPAFLLQESLAYLLLESGGIIMLEGEYPSGIEFTKRIQPTTTTYTRRPII